MSPKTSLVMFFSVLASACASEDPSFGKSSSALTIDNKLATNKLATNKLATNKLATNKLATNKLATNKLATNKLATNGLLETPDGRDVLRVIVSCALPRGVTLVGEVDGVTYEFPGDIGLAKAWIHRPLDEVEQGWISACVFARVNAHDVSVVVSLRGPHHALEVADDEAVTFTLEEGAFYGNLFTPEDAPIDWHACRGKDQASRETGDLVDRDCTEPDAANAGLTQCGFSYAGDCGAFAPRRACKGFSTAGTYYRRCFADPILGGRHGDDDDGGEAFRQVITTFVRP